LNEGGSWDSITRFRYHLFPWENEFGFLGEPKSHEGAFLIANNQSRLYAFSLKDGESNKVAV
jgi:hypothetical protein